MDYKACLEAALYAWLVMREAQGDERAAIELDHLIDSKLGRPSPLPYTCPPAYDAYEDES